MTNEDLESFQNSLKEKLGDENMGMIADDLGSLIAKTTKAIETKNSLETEVEKLKEDKEKLVVANGKLLQQVPMADEPKKIENEPKQTFSFREQFDEKGNFIK